ncbi:Hsp40/DnaJ [Acrasis kona]|uniref:DnaJ homolog subfamily C member 10 n=1 Tax=Acrasis kona TaxID=1008807 RepID=A0AAW2YIT8_9EUKA
MVKQVDKQDEFKKELSNAGDRLVVVDFFAVWCGPCKQVAPIYEKLAEKHKNTIFLKVDVDINKEVAQSERITQMPTFNLYKNGKKISSQSDISQLEGLINKHGVAERPAEPLPTLDTAEQYKEEGNKKFKSQDFEGALVMYTRAIEKNPSEHTLYTNRAATYLQLKQYKEAAADATKATEIDPKFAKGWFRLGQSNLQMGKMLEAKLSLQKALDITPNDKAVAAELNNLQKITTYVEGGQNNLSQNKNEEALNQFNLALQLAPQSTALKLLRGRALIAVGKFSDAAKEAGIVLRDFDPSSSDAYFVRGKALYYDGSVENGLKHVNEALRMDPDNQACLQFRKQLKSIENAKEDGNKSFKSGDYQDAIDKYAQAVQIDPLNKVLNSTIYCNLSTAATKQGKHEDSVKYANSAIDLNPNNTKAYVRRADSNTTLGNHEDAMRDYQKACELDEGNASFKSKLRESQKAYKKAKRKDYYKILGIDKNADEDAIKKAYRKKALEWHPDKFQEEDEKKKAEEMFKDIGEAVSVLSDAQKRRRYDSGVDLEDMDSCGHGGGFGDVDVNDIFRMFMGGGMGGGGGMRFSTGGMGGMGGGRRGGGFGGGFPF